MKFCFKIILTGIIKSVIIFIGFSQEEPDRTVLEKRKKETIEQIEYTRKLLENTRRSASVTLSQVNLLSRNIENREKLISELDKEVKILEYHIELNRVRIDELEIVIDSLKKEYERIIIAAYRNIDQGISLEYILGAQDINQGYQRLKYIKYINNYRKSIYNDIIGNIELLYEENIRLKETLNETGKLKLVKENELKVLNRERGEKRSSVNSLKRKETQLRQELSEKQRIQKKLEEEINKIIEEEIRKAKAKSIALLTPAEKELSASFVNNIGKLPWPVEKGILTGKFGEHDHPVIKGIKIKSNGIDINTVEGEKARAIFDGEVTKIIAILGANYTVIIKHGEFYSVYTNLINISVKMGGKVKRNDFIGTIYTDNNKSTKLHFQIWKDRILQDPEKWLSK